MKQILLVFALLLGVNVMSGKVSADIDVYEFQSEENRQKYLSLTKELRCPKCQNQDIADSNAPIAQDMRREVHRMVEQGQERQAVVDFMIERFGEFVTYKPKVGPETYLLWFGPWVLMALGLVVVFLMAKGVQKSRLQKKTQAQTSDDTGRGQSAAPLDAKDAERLQSLLSRYGNDATDKDKE